MKIATIIGARPQFVKAACVSRTILEHNHKSSKPEINEVIIHTGQHFDYGMSDIFFKELEIPEPKYNLGISSLSHGAMLGKMIEKIEEVLISEKPDIVLFYGDTNSTLAGALAAIKLHIPTAHVEAGLRSFNNRMPEEYNRILTDRVSSLLFAPTELAVQNLLNEGFENFDNKIVNSGDVMFDSLLRNKEKEVKPHVEIPEEFILATLHRPETTNNFDNLNNCIEVFKNKCPIPVLLILHPGTKKKLDQYKINLKSDNLKIIPPLSYHEMLYLLKRCKLVATDSGGLQKEAFWYNKYCVTLRNETEWIELVENGFNAICGYNKDTIIKNIDLFLSNANFHSKNFDFYGKGNTSKIILKEIITLVQEKEKL
ncbi:MAG: UDP-N-acetylglucosamine 2-epimerase (non-hydrolyzing) [Candidatus Delongbacteria bacterium]|nr:UDP-N-acetylglucosamine 2-epimerase (non-hydrolyzing) [Candidatus Delongbacteria bacterium]